LTGALSCDMRSILKPIKRLELSHAGTCAACSVAPHNKAKVPHDWARFVIAAVLACTVLIPAGLASERAPTRAPISAEQLDALLKQKEYPELLAALDNPDARKSADYEFFAGVVANRTNQLNRSIRRLKQAIPVLQKQGAHDREQIAWETLADGYASLGRYAEAADTYAALETRFGNEMSPREKAGMEDEARQWGLLRHVPPQSVSIAAAFTVPTKPNPLGVFEVPVEVAGETRYWVLDTGANISAMSKSEARRLGLHPLEGTTEVKGVTGNLVPIQVAVVPELRLGKARLRNVVFVLLDDRDLLVSQPHYQIDGIIGYPVLTALGRITFDHNGTFAVDVSTKPPLHRDYNLFIEKETPLVAARIGDTTCLFTLDTGIQRTILTARYYREHSSDFAAYKANGQSLTGVGGTRSLPAYTIGTLPLQLAGHTTTLHGVPVLTNRVGKTFDDFCGTLGLDAVQPFSAFTLDFHNMQLDLR
jgi:hypothetical protein